MLGSLHMRQGRCQYATWTSTEQRVRIVRNWGTEARRTPLIMPGCVADAVASTEAAASAVPGHSLWRSEIRHTAVQAQPRCRQVLQTRVTGAHAAATAAHSAAAQPLQEQHAVIVKLAQGMQQSTAPVFERQLGHTAARPAAQQQQRHKQRGKGQGRDAAAAAGSLLNSAPGPSNRKHKVTVAAHGRKGCSSSRHQSQAPVQLPPCERGNTLRVASAVSKLLLQGQAVVLPAGTGMQVPRGVAALASARTLLLSTSSSTGLVFQPSFISKSTAAGGNLSHAALVGNNAATTTAAAEEASAQGSKANTGSKNSSTSSSSLVLTACRIAEVQLRRHEQNPLIAARYGSPSQLAAAVVARVCQQGLTAVRASGPDAVRVAMHAVTQARQKLVAHGLDIVVAPITEFVDVDSLPGQQDQQQFVEYESNDSVDAGYDADDNSSRQFVRVTVLHVVRCHRKQPWKLLPQPVPVAQQPAAIWQKRRQCKQSQQQPSELVMATVVQQQQHAVPLLQPQEFASVGAEQPGHQQEQLAQAEQQPSRQQDLQPDVKPPEQHQQSQYSLQQPVFTAQQQQAVSDDVRLSEGAVCGASSTTSQPSGLAQAVAVTAANNTVTLLRHMQSAGRPQQPQTGVELSSNCSSVSSIDGSIWCQPEDARFTAVYVGEGAACAGLGDDDILQGSAACPSTKHPGQPMLLHKQRREASSKRQLVAAAQGQGQVPASSGY